MSVSRTIAQQKDDDSANQGSGKQNVTVDEMLDSDESNDGRRDEKDKRSCESEYLASPAQPKCHRTEFSALAGDQMVGLSVAGYALGGNEGFAGFVRPPYSYERDQVREREADTLYVNDHSAGRDRVARRSCESESYIRSMSGELENPMYMRERDEKERRELREIRDLRELREARDLRERIQKREPINCERTTHQTSASTSP